MRTPTVGPNTRGFEHPSHRRTVRRIVGRHPWYGVATRLLPLLSLAACASPRSVNVNDGATADAAPREASTSDALATDEAVATDAETPGEDASIEDATSEPGEPLDEGAPGEDAAEDTGEPADESAPPGFPLAGAGPLTPRTQSAMVTLPASTGCAGALCTVTLQWTTPIAPDATRAAPYPLVVLSNGFQLPSSQYNGYALRLASWGYSTLRWDTSETLLRSLGHETLAKMLVALVSHAASENDRADSPVQGLVSTTRVLLAGHSRGGKVSVLAATRDSRVAGVVGIDPVDSAPMFASPASEYPSAVTALRNSPRMIPLLAVGAGLASTSPFGMPCAPANANYTQFWSAARTPAWEVAFPEAGHMSFLDNPNCGVTCSVCTAGRAPADRVRAATKTLLVAWAERVLRDADVSAYGPGGAWFTETVAGGFVTGRSR